MWERSNLVQDAWFVALDRGKYVGMTELWSNQADPELFDIGVTGVLALSQQTGDCDGAEAARDRVRAEEGGFGNCVRGMRRQRRSDFWK